MSKILEQLWKEEKRLEKSYSSLEDELKRIFSFLFSASPIPYFDWLLRVIDEPGFGSVLGMPATCDSGQQIRSLIASNSPFSESLRTQIAHRLYSVLQIISWLENNPLIPNWIRSYQGAIGELRKALIKDYILIRSAADEGKINKAWELNKWDNFHDVTSLDISFLFPNLQFLNDPGSRKPEICNSRKGAIDITRRLADELTRQLDIADNNRVRVKEYLFVDVSKWLWSIDTFLLNKRIFIKHRTLATRLIQELIKIGLANLFDLDFIRAKQMPAPELYTRERTLLFATGWSLEIDLLCDQYQSTELASIMSRDERESFVELRNRMTDIALKGINMLAGEGDHRPKGIDSNSHHLYFMCQRFWLFLEFWQYRAIRSAVEMKKKSIERYTQNPVANIYYFNNLWKRIRVVLSAQNVKEVKDLKNLPGSLYSIFILGGEGVGKTTLVRSVFKELFGAEEEVQQYNPFDIDTPLKLLDILDKYKTKFVIFFLDEMHFTDNIYALMLGPLQERRVSGKKLEGKIMYVFASSAFRNKDEFIRMARERALIPMRDFASRIGHWIELPDIWQVPEQKYILAYYLSKAKLISTKKKHAALITINPKLREARSIERALHNVRLIEESVKYIRGDVASLFEN